MPASQEEVLLEDTNPAPNKKSQPEQSRRTIFARYVQDWWLIELLCLLLGVIAITALCVLLNHYDHKPAPQANAVVGVKITFNTLVSILSTIGRVTLLLPISEAISQSKWTWYRDDYRPLGDLATFDGASRGLWGGLQLLWKVNVRQIASLGAILVIVGLAVDPLSQQLVHYRVKTVSGLMGSANLPAAVQWLDGQSQDTNAFVGISNPNDETPDPSLSMKGAIQNGLYSQNTDIHDLQPACSSGNCIWPSYSSLAICARSADVTSYLRTKDVFVPDDFSHGPSGTLQKWSLSHHNSIIGYEEVYLNLSSVAQRAPIFSSSAIGSGQSVPISLNFTDSIAFKDSALPIAGVFMIYSNTTQIGMDHLPSFAAIEFVLEWCIQNFTTTVVNGVSSTQRHDALRDFSTPDPEEPSAFLQAKSDDKYMISSSTHYTLQHYFRGLFQGTVNTTMGSAVARLSATSDATAALFNPFDQFGENDNGTDQNSGRGVGLPGLQRILDNTARGMTNAIRTDYNRTSDTVDASFITIQGSADHQQTYVEIQWGWIAAPTILLVGTVIFLLAAIVSSSNLTRRPNPRIWKSSTLPLLKALSAELHQEGFSGMQTTSAMEDWAQGVQVRLTGNGGGDGNGKGWQLTRNWSDGKSAGQELREWNE